MNTFWAFPEKMSSKFGNFAFILLLILAKWWLKSFAELSQVICECLFLPGTSRFICLFIFIFLFIIFLFIFYFILFIYLFIFFFFLGGGGAHSAECMNIIEIDILSLLENTRYFIP